MTNPYGLSSYLFFRWVLVLDEASPNLAELLQQPIRLVTRNWHSDQVMGQALALMLMEQAEEIARWQTRPERLLMFQRSALLIIWATGWFLGTTGAMTGKS